MPLLKSAYSKDKLYTVKFKRPVEWPAKGHYLLPGQETQLRGDVVAQFQEDVDTAEEYTEPEPAPVVVAAAPPPQVGPKTLTPKQRRG